MPTKIKKKINFIMLIASGFHRYGASADRIETALFQLSDKLNIKANFFSLPTSISACFVLDENTEEARMERLEIGKINLTKLYRVDKVIDLVIDGDLSVEEGSKRVKEIIDDKMEYSNLLASLSYALIASSICLIFKGNIYDIVASLILGLFVGILTESVKKERVDSILDVFISFFISVSSLLLLQFDLPVHPQIINISSLIVLIPGLMLTTSIGELASQNITSGTARLFGSFMIMLKISIGVYMGHMLVKALGLATTSSSTYFMDPNLLLYTISILVVSVGLMVTFQARTKDFIWVLIACTISFSSTQILTLYLGDAAALFCSGAIIAALSNTFSRVKKMPSLIFLLPAIILLVPGSIGHRALGLILENNIDHGISSLVSMALVAVSLVTGIFFGSVIVKPKRFL